MSNWERNLRVGMVLVLVAGVVVDAVGVLLVLRKIEREIDQPFDLGVRSERRRAELEAQDQAERAAQVIPLDSHTRRSS